LSGDDASPGNGTTGVETTASGAGADLRSDNGPGAVAVAVVLSGDDAAPGNGTTDVETSVSGGEAGQGSVDGVNSGVDVDAAVKAETARLTDELLRYVVMYVYSYHFVALLGTLLYVVLDVLTYQSQFRKH